MKKKIKRIFPFLICFCLFFLLVDDVIASSKKFKEDMNAQICYDTKTFNLIKYGSGAWDNCAEQNDDGAGLRYEIQEFISCILNKRFSTARLRRRESICMAEMMEQFTNRKNFMEI